MSKQNIEESVESRVCFEELEDWVREKIQGWVQGLLEEEVTELLGRRKSERRRAVDAPSGYGNGLGSPSDAELGDDPGSKASSAGSREHFESRVLPLFAKRNRELPEPMVWRWGILSWSERAPLGEKALSSSSTVRLKEKSGPGRVTLE